MIVIVEPLVTVITLNASKGFPVRHRSNVPNNSCTMILLYFTWQLPFVASKVAMDNEVYILNNLNL